MFYFDYEKLLEKKLLLVIYNIIQLLVIIITCTALNVKFNNFLNFAYKKMIK